MKIRRTIGRGSRRESAQTENRQSPVPDQKWIRAFSRRLLPGIGFIAALSLLHAQEAATPYAVTARDANSSVWERTTYERSPDGRIVPRKHSYTELATGLNYLKNGAWTESKEEIDILPQGGAVATQGQHQAYFPGDIYQGQIEVVTPDGLHLKSRPLGISYDDGGNTVFIAMLTNSIGELVGSNQVVYPNAFSGGFKADLRYTYKKGGFEQDIVLRERPPAPESFGLNSNARLQVLTEFFDAPEPKQTASAVNKQDGLSDTTLAFGQMKMIRGKAFAIGSSSGGYSAQTKQSRLTSAATRVYKSWVHVDGRMFLVEEVPVRKIAAQLEQLPIAGNATVSSVHPNPRPSTFVTRHLVLPPLRWVQKSTNAMQLAKADFNSKSGVVLDYVTINSDQTDFTFQGDTTYYVGGEYNLSGTTIFEGGTVIKLDGDGQIDIDASGAINCQTAAYRPAVFTSINDNSVGETISGSSGSPSYSDVFTYLNINSLTTVLHDMRFCFSGSPTIIVADGNQSLDIWNCQFITVDALVDADSCNLGLHNVLIDLHDVPAPDAGILIGDGDVAIENVTFRNANAAFIEADDDGIPIGLTNCLVVGSLGGNNSLLSTNCTMVLPGSAVVFQAVGGGDSYLTNSSPYRDAGTTNISPVLLAELRQKTTYPPIVYSNTTISTATTFSPQAQRDTDTPDLGYHYDPLDYIFSNVTLSATLTLTNGVAVGVCGSSSIYGCVINPQTGAKIVSVGLPQTMNRIVSCQNVQEQPLSAPESGFVLLNTGTDASRTFQFRFTDFSVGQGARASLFLSGSGMGPFQTIAFQDCWLRGANLSGNAIPAYGNETIGLTNNLILRGYVGFAYNGGYSYAALFNSYNNLFQGGAFFATLQLGSQIISGWNVKDNLFDGATQSIYTDGGGSSQLYISNNGFTAGTANSLGGSTNETNLTADYQMGPLGNYYYPTSGGNLSQLIDAGSTTANLVGLYNYTTQTNQTEEGASPVDIGYHYVALDQYGNILDSDSDGLPDWWEMYWFGNFDHTGSELDPNGNTLLYDYENGIDPNIIQFSLQFTNNYVNATPVYGGIAIQGGVPSYEAILINDTNTSDADWQPYDSTNIIVSLSAGNGLYNVLVGLKGLPGNATPTWVGTQLTLNTVAPVLAVTNPAPGGTVSVPMIQLQGYVSESLSSLTFDVSNAVGVVTNQTGYCQPVFYDTNLFDFTTNTFQCYDIPLTNGVNEITLHAIDMAGNTTTTNFSYTLSYAGVTNAPALSVLWPPNNTAIGGSSVTIQAQISDATATVAATVNGSTVQGLIERSGLVWLQNLPLNSGTNVVTITTTSAAGNSSTNTLNVVESSVNLTIDPISDDQLNQSSVTVTGSVSSASYNVWVNGIEATVSGDPVWEATNVPVSATGTASLLVQVGTDLSHIIASQTLNQPQSALVALMSYSTHLFGAGMGMYGPFSYQEDDNWTFQAGGNEVGYGDSTGQFGGQNDGAWSTNFAAGDGGFDPIDSSEVGTWENVSTLDQGPWAFEEIHTRTRVMIEPPGQAAIGQTALYLVKVQAYDSSDSEFEWEWPTVPPQEMSIDGLALTPDPEDGSWGETLVSGPAGSQVEVTPRTAVNGAIFGGDEIGGMAVQQLHLAIIDTNSGMDLTLQTNSVIVGQQMNWQCRLSMTNSFMTNFPLTNFHWTIPGYAISNYVANDGSGIVYTNFSTVNSNVVFYWVDGVTNLADATNRVVQISATVNGKTVTGQATFKVLRPTGKITATTISPITLDYADGPATLHFGSVQIGTQPGILFSNSITMPSGYTGNTNYTFEWVQKVIYLKERLQTNDGSGAWYSLQASNVLDTQYPYPSPDTRFSNACTTDSPGSDGLDGYQAVSFTNNFTMWLMFQPSGGVVVPLRMVNWSWNGTGTFNGVTGSVTSSNAVANPDSDATDNYPVWTDNVTNHFNLQRE